MNNPQLAFVGVKNNNPPAELSADWVNSRMERYEREEYGLLSALEVRSGELIGMAGIIPTEVEGTVYYQIGYSVKPEYWNKGYASEMAVQMQTYAEKHVSTSMLIAIINLENHNSVKIAEKLGMSIWKRTNFKGSEVNIYAVQYA